ncbi:MAG: branched-chain amino acid ABC transporter permease [Thermomonas sp.]|uniref:branched-chain amino acid ABC transporter permease n=1 Tax=Thermomonas sp. TaxID=1971895 RepID=UPI0026297141|nr:branched-chain amino acid ABC transporter permease [Thermomonas sp.]MCC7096822.1 branched-chain amino acid ABC transporter permease [Thermomonas sp.]
MDLFIASMLAQDGLVNGAIYGLLGFALVLVFSVTRVIFLPQGEFVAFGALTYGALVTGHVPGTIWLLLALVAIEAGRLCVANRSHPGRMVRKMLWLLVPSGLTAGAVLSGLVTAGGPWVQALASVFIVGLTGPLLYRLVFLPVRNASVLLLLFVAVALHWVLLGIGLAIFGAEGQRAPALIDVGFDVFGVPITGSTLSVLAFTAIALVLLGLVFGRTLFGLALRATAINPLGARIVGVRTEESGSIAFGIASFIGALGGVLIAPITTVYYDTGFLIGLKGFVAAIFGGLQGYALTAVGALFVGLVESGSAFYASAFKDALVFGLILPLVLYRSLRSTVRED